MVATFLRRAAPLTLAAMFLAVLHAPVPPAEARPPAQTDVCGNLQGAVVWNSAGSPYRVTCDVRVPAGVTLAIEPGTVVRFDRRTTLEISGGGLTISGTGHGDVTFTSSADVKAKGDYKGILVSGGTASVSGLSIEYAGDAAPAISLRSGTLTVANTLVENSGNVGIGFRGTGSVSGTTVRDSAQAGLSVDRAATSPDSIPFDLTGSTFEGNARAVEIIGQVHLRHSGNSARRNQVNGIVVDGSLVGQVTWYGSDLPYVLFQSMAVNGQLTVQPDTWIKVDRGRGIDVNGRLELAGTEAQPIVLTSLNDDLCSDTGGRVDCDTRNDGASTTPVAGDWGKLDYKRAGAGVVTNVRVRYGGGPSVVMGAPNVPVNALTVANASGVGLDVTGVNAAIMGSAFENNGGHAIQVSGSTPVTLTVQASTFSGNRGAVVRAPAETVLVVGGNDHVNFSNSLNGYALAGAITTPRTWSAADLPYIVDANIDLSRAAADLTIEPGATVKLREDVGFRVTAGRLRVGTPDGDRVLITALTDDACTADVPTGCDTNGDGSEAQPGPGYWRNIDVSAQSRGLFMERTVVRYAGGRTSAVATLDLDRDSSVKNSEIAFGRDAAILISHISTSLEGNHLHSNQGHGVMVEAGTSPIQVTLINNRIENNRSIRTDRQAAAVDMEANTDLVIDAATTATGNDINGIAVRGNIMNSRLWRVGQLPYVVTNDVSVMNGSTLTLEPGVIVKFDARRALKADRGALIAEGTVEEPIVFTSLKDDSVGGDTNTGAGPGGPVAGDWGGIDIGEQSLVSSLGHASVRYAGANNTAALRIKRSGITIRDSTFSFGSGAGILLDRVPRGTSEGVDILNNTIRDMSGDGIVMTGTAGPTQPNLQGNTIANNRYAMALDMQVQPSLGGNVATGNQVNGMVISGALTSRRTWQAAELPWVLDGTIQLQTNGWLDIEGGAVIKARPGALLRIDRSGSLQVPKAGTTGRVWFTSVKDDSVCIGPDVCDTNGDGPSEGLPGDWRGIRAELQTASLGLDNVAIHYGGGNGASVIILGPGARIRNSEVAYSRDAAIHVDGATGVEITGNILRNGDSAALLLEEGGSGTVTGNVFAENARSVIHTAVGQIVMYDNVAIGNGADAMLYCADVRSDQVWVADLAREISCTVTVTSGNLVVEPGSILQFSDGAGINVNTSMEAEGVVFVGANPLSLGGAWRGLGFRRDSSGFVRHSLFFSSGGTSLGAIDVASIPRPGREVHILYNTILRMRQTGLSVSDGGSPNVAGNLIRDIDGNNTAAIRVRGETSRPNIVGNALFNADTGVYTTAASPVVNLNNLNDLNNAGIYNATRTVCVDGQRNWWGHATGPRDTNDEGGVCPQPRINEGGQGIPAGQNTNYQGWLTEAPPHAPFLELPMCGITNVADQVVAGDASPGTTVVIFDGDREIGQAVAGADGRFQTTLRLADGDHRLSVEARGDVAGQAVASPRTGFRVVTVDAASPVDPAGIRFEYGPSGSRRMQPVRDEAGCATGCGGRTSGRVTIPAGESVIVHVPAAAAVNSLEFVQGGRPAVPLTRRGGIWSSDPFVPAEGPFSFNVNAGATECMGYLYPRGGGYVFADLGAPGGPILSEDFESGSTNWQREKWQVTDKRARSGRYSVTDSPDGPYNNNEDNSLILPSLNLREIAAPELGFYHSFEFASGDQGTIDIRTRPDGTWRELARFQGSAPEFVAGRISLDAYARESEVWLRFRVRSDARNNADGWYVDDIEVRPGGRGNGRWDAGEPLVENADVLLLQRNLATGLWREWSGGPTGQSNPQRTDELGRYGFFNLPRGEYRLRVNTSPYGPAMSPVLAVWDGTFEYALPLSGGEPVYLPVNAARGRIGR